jgi:hypothetical protein
MKFVTPPEFPVEVCKQLWNTYGDPHHSFYVQEAEELSCKLSDISYYALWLKFLIPHVLISLAYALCLNRSELMCSHRAC